MVRWYIQHQLLVQVWLHDDDPCTVQEVYIRCKNCNGGWVHRAAQYAPIDYRKPRNGVKLVPIRVMPACRCSPDAFELETGTCPPWLTREERVAWHLSA